MFIQTLKRKRKVNCPGNKGDEVKLRTHTSSSDLKQLIRMITQTKSLFQCPQRNVVCHLKLTERENTDCPSPPAGLCGAAERSAAG